jgi:hypothetical protein
LTILASVALARVFVRRERRHGLEAGFISDRIKAALAAAKRRGKKLGGFRPGAKLTAKARPAKRARRPMQMPPLRARRTLRR